MAKAFECFGYKKQEGVENGGIPAIVRIQPNERSINVNIRFANDKQWFPDNAEFPYEVIDSKASGQDLDIQDRLNGFDYINSGDVYSIAAVIASVRENGIHIVEMISRDTAVTNLQYRFNEQLLATQLFSS